MNTQIMVDLTLSLGWIINREKAELKPTQVFSLMGYEYHLDSALVYPTQDRWLNSLIQRIKSKPASTARCLMSLIGLLESTEKMVPDGRLQTFKKYITSTYSVFGENKLSFYCVTSIYAAWLIGIVLSSHFVALLSHFVFRIVSRIWLV